MPAKVVDTALGAALGYERPRKIRELIERFPRQLRESGVLPNVGEIPPIRKGEAARVMRAY
jgi:hypothetical protein